MAGVPFKGQSSPLAFQPREIHSSQERHVNVDRNDARPFLEFRDSAGIFLYSLIKFGK
jgi:hypothetical protein